MWPGHHIFKNLTVQYGLHSLLSFSGSRCARQRRVVTGFQAWPGVLESRKSSFLFLKGPCLPTLLKIRENPEYNESSTSRGRSFLVIRLLWHWITLARIVHFDHYSVAANLGLLQPAAATSAHADLPQDSVHVYACCMHLTLQAPNQTVASKICCL